MSATPEGVKLSSGRWYCSKGPPVGWPDVVWIGESVRCSGQPETLELHEVEGVDVPEHDRLDLVDTAHEQPSQAVIAHVRVGPLGGEAASVDGLGLVGRHALAPSDGAEPVAPLGLARIAPA